MTIPCASQRQSTIRKFGLKARKQRRLVLGDAQQPIKHRARALWAAIRHLLHLVLKPQRYRSVLRANLQWGVGLQNKLWPVREAAGVEEETAAAHPEESAAAEEEVAMGPVVERMQNSFDFFRRQLG